MNPKNFKPIFFLVLGGLLTFTGCSSKEDTPPMNQISNQVETNLHGGFWRITRFIDSAEDQTNDFTGYIFSFGVDGSLGAANGTNTYNGTWSLIDSNSQEDSLEDLDFLINFNLTNDFEGLNQDWDLVSQSSVSIELLHISGGNGGTDNLTFEKN